MPLRELSAFDSSKIYMDTADRGGRAVVASIIAPARVRACGEGVVLFQNIHHRRGVWKGRPPRATVYSVYGKHDIPLTYAKLTAGEGAVHPARKRTCVSVVSSLIGVGGEGGVAGTAVPVGIMTFGSANGGLGEAADIDLK